MFVLRPLDQFLWLLVISVLHVLDMSLGGLPDLGLLSRWKLAHRLGELDRALHVWSRCLVASL